MVSAFRETFRLKPGVFRSILFFRLSSLHTFPQAWVPERWLLEPAKLVPGPRCQEIVGQIQQTLMREELWSVQTSNPKTGGKSVSSQSTTSLTLQVKISLDMTRKPS